MRLKSFIQEAPVILPPVLIGIFMATCALATPYYVSQSGSDSNPGTLNSPWKTIQKAANTLKAGDIAYIRSGQYTSVFGGWTFNNSGTSSLPITFSNYPGEQVIIKITQTALDYRAFRCWAAPTDPVSWQTPKANFIRIIGTDVTPSVLSNGIASSKGIVVQGVLGQQSAGIDAAGCDSWEVAGIDFVEVGYGIFTHKRNFQTTQDNSADKWYVHDNRVYNYYRESGMQFDGNYNRVEHNEIYKVSNELDTPFGCQLLNINGNNSTFIGNTLSRKGSTASCGGILFEWDLSDANTVEQNLIFDVPWGIEIQGGDNNLIRNNIIYTTGVQNWGIGIESYDNRSSWPCDEVANALYNVPGNDSASPDYQYYYNPRNCHSYGNQIYNNTIHGFTQGIHFNTVVGENTIIRNNAVSGWQQGAICRDSNCNPIFGVTADHNVTQSPFGFVDIQNFDFHLAANSSLIDQGYNLGSLVPNDFDGHTRPQGAGFDVGAYETSQLSPLMPPTNLTVK